MYTLEQYNQMSVKFNKKTFREKIEILIKHKNILQLGCDGNWFVVKVIDQDIQEQLYESDCTFQIENEWNSNEIYTLIQLLGINTTDA